MKIIEKYGTVGNNIVEVNEEDPAASNAKASKNDETIKKQPRKKLNLGKVLDKDTFNQASQRNLKT